MNKDDLISIICLLKYNYNDFHNVKLNFTYELSGREYEINLHRDNGRMMKFSIEDINVKEVQNENH